MLRSLHALAAAACAFVCAWAMLAAAPAAAAERRVALVIGNADYRIDSLDIANARADAEDTAAALRTLGFDVLLRTDIDLAAASKTIQQFARMAVGADAAVFYYAGHAVQFQGRNYLLPVDAEVRDDISLPFETIAVDSIRAALDRSAGVKIMILDACRTNPVADRLAKVASAGALIGPGERTRGLAAGDRSDGLLVAYSTAPGAVALDGDGRNSPFTKALLRRLAEPGLEVETMFRRIAADVSAATGGRQRPETYVSLIKDYILNQADRIASEQIRATDDPAVLREFSERFPSSFYAIEARHRREALERAIAAARERAEREAEIARREKEAAEQAAAARLVAEQACARDRAALDAAAPRDADALRRLAAQGCADVRAEAGQRLGALQAVLAAEAEACRRDDAALAAVAPLDLAALRVLAETGTCPAIQAATRLRIADAEAEIARAAEACRSEQQDIERLAQAGDRAGLDALRAQARCAATPARIAEGLGAIAAAAKAACARDEAALAATPPRDVAALRALLYHAVCEPVRAAGAARLAELETLIAREVATCADESATLAPLIGAGDRAAIAALKARAQCPATAAAADLGLRHIDIAADAACAKADAVLAAIGPRDASALRAFGEQVSCPAVAAAAAERVQLADAALASEAEACVREQGQWTQFAAPGDGAAMKALRAGVSCPAVLAAIDKALADLDAVCAREQSALAAAGPADADAARTLAAAARCDAVRAAARSKVARIEADAASREEACRRDGVELAALRSLGSDGRDRLLAFKRRLSCPRLRSDLEAALEQAAPPPSPNRLLQRPRRETLAAPQREPPAVEAARPRPAEPKPARERAARPAPAEKPVRLTRPAQPAAPPAQATASQSPAAKPRAAASPLGVGF